MALDPQIEIILQLAKQANLPEVWQLTPDQAREQYLTRVNRLKFSEKIFRTEDRRIAGRAATSRFASTPRASSSPASACRCSRGFTAAAS